MNNRDYFTSKLLLFVSNDDKLSLKNTSKGWQKSLRRHQEAPYQDRVEFILGVSGLFYDRDHLMKAWEVYHYTATSTSMKPALLYKCSDLDGFKIDGTLQRFLQNEDQQKTGRIYCPGQLHAWDVNQVWLLAQIHHARPFVLYSELNTKTVMRRNYPTVYSALTKEVSTVVKARYTLSITGENHIQLNPDKEKSAIQASLDDINVNSVDNDSAVKTINDAILCHKHAVHAAKEIKTLFSNIETYDLSTLTNFKPQIDAMVSSIIDNLFSKFDTKRLALTSFVKEFNTDKPYFSAELEDKNESRLYFEKTEIERLKTVVKFYLEKRVNDCIKYSAKEPEKVTYGMK